MSDEECPADAFERLNARGGSTDLDGCLNGAGAVSLAELSRMARVDQRGRWQRGDRRPVEEYFLRFPDLQADDESAVDLIYHEYLLREKIVGQPSLEEFAVHFPRHAQALSEQVRLHRALAETCPNDNSSSVRSAFPSTSSATPSLPTLPAQFGRYRLLELLGQGGMGCVYLADDAQLGRQVALKLPRFDRDESAEALERFRREASIAATFHHPNLCPVYDLDELDGKLFFTMPLMSGESLASRLQSGLLEEGEACQLALKIARAMAVAHRAGVIHRDLKPSNIFLRDDGEPVVMDFGLARRSPEVDADFSEAGSFVGTLAYMSPERLSSPGAEIRPSSDMYSLGVVLYEMLTGRLPFEGGWRELCQRIPSECPRPPSHHVPKLAGRLDAICMRALAKDPGERFGAMDELASALASFVDDAYGGPRARSDSRRWRRFKVVTVAAAVLVAIFSWPVWQLANTFWAQRQIAHIENLARAGRTFEAYDLVVRHRDYLRTDAKLGQLVWVVSDILAVTSEPPGSKVYLKRFVPDSAGQTEPRKFVDTTPFSGREVARGSYVVSIEKDGYDPFQRTWSSAITGQLDAPIRFDPIPIHATLTQSAPAGMIFVPGGEDHLECWNRPTEAKVVLNDFFIDKFEVANREYQEFVDAGGYENESFWKHAFMEGGRTLTWAEAMGKFRDKTGRPGPRGWSHGRFPEGQAEHPVTEVTWYEAAAYAAFRGKTLPTIFQWERAAREGVSNDHLGITLPWGLYNGPTSGCANFASQGTVPVGSFEFGMSPFGCYEMAGNASEWCLNETAEGFVVRGGSWASVEYEFGACGRYPSFHFSERIGFRCVMNAPGAIGDQGAMRVDVDDEAPQFTPAPEAEVKKSFVHYQYTNRSLEDRIVETVHARDWIRQKIEYRGAGEEMVPAYLYLPKRFHAPHQVVHILPAGDVWYGYRTLTQSIEADYGTIIRSGRAVFAVVLRGFLGREKPDGLIEPDPGKMEYVEDVATRIIDLRRGLDFLETRPDLDADIVAFLGSSFGGPMMVLPAIESDRYRAVILCSAALRKSELFVNPAARSFNFAPLIKAPKLLLHGLYDEMSPYETEGMPLYNLLSQPKQVESYPGGHRPDMEDYARRAIAFLDVEMGPVSTTSEGPAR